MFLADMRKIAWICRAIITIQIGHSLQGAGKGSNPTQITIWQGWKYDSDQTWTQGPLTGITGIKSTLLDDHYVS